MNLIVKTKDRIALESQQRFQSGILAVLQRMTKGVVMQHISDIGFLLLIRHRVALVIHDIDAIVKPIEIFIIKY